MTRMKCYHLLIRTLLFLATLSTALGVDPRTVSLRRRKPEPIIKFFSCCTKPTDAAFGARNDLRVVPENSAGPRIRGPQPVSDVEGLRDYPAQPKPYPTQVERPKYTDDGRRYLVAVVAVSWNKKVLLIRDRRGTEGWRLPEGERREDESHVTQALSREARETAGINMHWNRWNQPKYLGKKETNFWKESKDEESNVDVSGARSHFFQFVVQQHEILDEWPGQGRWERKWATMEDAETSLMANNHPEHLAVLKNSAFLSGQKAPNGRGDKYYWAGALV